MLPFVPTPASREQARQQARQRARELAVSMGLRPAEPAGKLANEQEEGCTPVAADQSTLMGMPVVWSLREINALLGAFNHPPLEGTTGSFTTSAPPAPSGPSPMTEMPEWLDKGESIDLSRYFAFKNGTMPPASEERHGLPAGWTWVEVPLSDAIAKLTPNIAFMHEPAAS